MTTAVVNKILRATCSNSLFSAMEKTETRPSDFDLLVFAERYSRDYRTRLELLQLIEINTSCEFVQAQAARAIAYEKSKLERFSLPEKNCFYRVRIKIRPHLPEVSYLAKTYAGVLKSVHDYYENQVLEFDDSSRFTVTKLVVNDSVLPVLEIIKEDYYAEDTACDAFIQSNIALSAKDYMLKEGNVAGQTNSAFAIECAEDCVFAYAYASESNMGNAKAAAKISANDVAKPESTTRKGIPKGFEKSSFEDEYAQIPEGFQGEANYKGSFLMTSIVHIDLRDNTVLATDMGCTIQDCRICQSRPCLLFHAPRIPDFLSDLDLAYYLSRDDERVYGVVLVSLVTGIEDECAYFVPLFELDESVLDTKEKFLSFARNTHTFIEFPLLERVCEVKDAPPEIWKNLEIFKRLHKKFGQKSKPESGLVTDETTLKV